MSRLCSSQASGEDGSNSISDECARSILEACIRGEITSKDGAVDLELSREDIDKKLGECLANEYMEEFQSQRDNILDAILHSRYSNLYSLLRHHVTEETYLGIVRNQILVDVQVSMLYLVGETS